jgi:hypothetical protein
LFALASGLLCRSRKQPQSRLGAALLIGVRVRVRVCVCVCVCVGDMQYSATIKTKGSTTDRVCRLSEEEEEEETDLVSVLNIF